MFKLKIKQALQIAGIKQKDLTKAVLKNSTAEITISKLVNGKIYQKFIQLILDICKFLNIDPNFLFGVQSEKLTDTERFFLEHLLQKFFHKAPDNYSGFEDCSMIIDISKKICLSEDFINDLKNSLRIIT